MVPYDGTMPHEPQALGRPRDGRVDRAITSSTQAVLAEVGYTGLTVEAVAARAGTSKAAIYRRYGSRPEMIFASVVHGLDLSPPPDTGSLLGDLRALTAEIAESLSVPPPDVLPGLLADKHKDATFAATFVSEYVDVEQRCLTELLDRAVRRGELSRRPDPTVVHALLLGPIFARLFLLSTTDDGAKAGIAAFGLLVAEHAGASLCALFGPCPGRDA
jgi:AcrR family transcriptional regulator